MVVRNLKAEIFGRLVKAHTSIHSLVPEYSWADMVPSYVTFDLGVTRTINFGFFHSCSS